MDGVTLKISVQWEALAAKLGGLAGEALIMALTQGLAEGGEYAAASVVQEARQRGIASRTGTLLNSVGAQKAQEIRNLTCDVGVFDDSPASKYAYLLGDDVMTITPTGNKKYLTIPLDANKTQAGVPRFPSVAALRESYGSLVHRRGMAIGIGGEDDFVPYFALVTSVVVEGRKALQPGVDKAVPVVVETIQESVNRLISRG